MYNFIYPPNLKIKTYKQYIQSTINERVQIIIHTSSNTSIHHPVTCIESVNLQVSLKWKQHSRQVRENRPRSADSYCQQSTHRHHIIMYIVYYMTKLDTNWNMYIYNYPFSTYNRICYFTAHAYKLVKRFTAVSSLLLYL